MNIEGAASGGVQIINDNWPRVGGANWGVYCEYSIKQLGQSTDNLVSHPSTNLSASSVLYSNASKVDVTNNWITTYNGNGAQQGLTNSMPMFYSAPSGAAEPLESGTTYYAIITYGPTTTFRLAATRDDALAGTAITLLTQGTGDMTFTWSN